VIVVTFRAKRQYWEDLEPASGRPYSAPFSHPDNWGVTAVGSRTPIILTCIHTDSGAATHCNARQQTSASRGNGTSVNATSDCSARFTLTAGPTKFQNSFTFRITYGYIAVTQVHVLVMRKTTGQV